MESLSPVNYVGKNSGQETHYVFISLKIIKIIEPYFLGPEMQWAAIRQDTTELKENIIIVVKLNIKITSNFESFKINWLSMSLTSKSQW